MTTTDPVTIEVPRGTLIFPNVYETDQYGRYGATLPTSSLVGVLEGHVIDGLHYNRRDGVAMSRARSNYRPEVTALWNSDPWPHTRGDSVDQLVEELQRLDARNLPRDRVFRDRRTVLELRPHHYINPRYGEGFTLILLGITVYL